MEQTIVCPCCGEPYRVYDGFAFDQSACPACRGSKVSLRDRVRPS